MPIEYTATIPVLEAVTTRNEGMFEKMHGKSMYNNICTKLQIDGEQQRPAIFASTCSQNFLSSGGGASFLSGSPDSTPS